MDSFEINKIIAAVLLIALLTIGIAKISDLVFYVKKPDTPGYKVEVIEKTENKIENKKVNFEEVDISKLLALGSVDHGEKVFKKMFCLSFD